MVPARFLMDVLPTLKILANWLQPGPLMAGAVGGMGLLIGAFHSLRGDLKGEMREMKEEMKEEIRTGEDRVNKRTDEVKEEMKEFKQEMDEIKTPLIQALRLPPPAQP